jgi:heme oxygenase
VDVSERHLTGTLSRHLRVETADAHRAAERAFDLDRRLTSLAGYADALQAFDAFVVTSAPMLGALAPALPAALRDGPARRRSRLREDLAQLGRIPSSPDRVPAMIEIDLDRTLGAWYVHEGAALGGLFIAAEVRRRLPQAAGATTFFAGEGHGTAARWRAVQAVLDRAEPIDGERVVAGARATFSALIEQLAEVGA